MGLERSNKVIKKICWGRLFFVFIQKPETKNKGQKKGNKRKKEEKKEEKKKRTFFGTFFSLKKKRKSYFGHWSNFGGLL